MMRVLFLGLLGLGLAHGFSQGAASLTSQRGGRCAAACSQTRMGLAPGKKGEAVYNMLAAPAGSGRGIFGAAALAFLLAASPAPAPAEINPSMLLAIQELPEGWAQSVTEDGREFYYQIKSGKSQWEPPAGMASPNADSASSKKGPYSKKKGGSGQDLREVVPFVAPAVPIDRVVVRDKPTLKGQCGETDFRSNSVECGEPARNVIEDSAKKSVDTLGTMMNEKGVGGLKTRAEKAEERARMLQEAELKSLANTELFKRLDKQTKDPERAAERKKQIDEITARNDIGAQKAPWSAEEDPVGPPERGAYNPKLELPSIKLPEFKLPF